MSSQDRDSGFTMIELLVTISLLGIMMAIAVSGYSSWSKASGQSGEARQLQSVMRQAQQRAITEGRSICLSFRVTQNDYSIYRGVCDDPTRTLVVGPVKSGSSTTHFATPAFTATTGTSTGVTFKSRGTATPGSVQLTRTGSSRVYTLSVEGLTGRVSLS